LNTRSLYFYIKWSLKQRTGLKFKVVCKMEEVLKFKFPIAWPMAPSPIHLKPEGYNKLRQKVCWIWEAWFLIYQDTQDFILLLFRTRRWWLCWCAHFVDYSVTIFLVKWVFMVNFVRIPHGKPMRWRSIMWEAGGLSWGRLEVHRVGGWWWKG
jgi:hypothetical protein